MHDGESLGVIQRVIAEAVVAAGAFRIRTLSLSDEELALNIMNTLEEHGLRIVRVENEGT